MNAITIQSHDYSIAADLDGAIAIVCIPGQWEPSAMIFGSESHLIRSAHEQTRKRDAGFSRLTEAELIDVYGDYADVPANALAIARQHGEVVDWNDEFRAPAEGDELAWALEMMADDLNHFRCFRSVQEAIEWMRHYNGHQAGKAVNALVTALVSAGHLESDANVLRAVHAQRGL